MSNRELCAQLLNTVPDYKIGYVLPICKALPPMKQRTMLSAKRCTRTI